MKEDQLLINNEEGLRCCKCDILLEADKINVRYLRSTFPTCLLRCPSCGQTYLPEDMAQGKVREVEMSLEEK